MGTPYISPQIRILRGASFVRGSNITRAWPSPPSLKPFTSVSPRPTEPDLGRKQKLSVNIHGRPRNQENNSESWGLLGLQSAKTQGGLSRVIHYLQPAELTDSLHNQQCSGERYAHSSLADVCNNWKAHCCRPKCAQCGINNVSCQWPEQRKRSVSTLGRQAKSLLQCSSWLFLSPMTDSRGVVGLQSTTS